ncbi:unnamed protein product [Paramecium primaurelia]|uniref:Transmembrane protein n=1 Tax=Paramecium primaurelia TaxID=5886 RepID=A0A8S1MKC9_PARPR|nr:unnamed protein product [Paramecium primaurelia]
MDQEDDTNDIEVQNIKEQKYQDQDSDKQKKMKVFMIIITIINIFQTLLNSIIFYYYVDKNSFFCKLSYYPDPSPNYYYYNYNYYLLGQTLVIVSLFFYPLMIILFRCFHKSTIFKKLSILIILLFFASFTLFTCGFYGIFLSFDQNSEVKSLYFYLAISDLLLAYLINSIYLCFTNYLFQRNFEIIQYVATIIITIIYMTYIIIQIKDIDGEIVTFQLIISIIYFQGIMTLYLMIQLHLLFQTLNSNYKLSLNDILYGYMQIQTRIFLFCFKD